MQVKNDFVPCREMDAVDRGDITIRELRKILDDLGRKYGDSSILRFDAGYNNIDVGIKRQDVYN